MKWAEPRRPAGYWHEPHVPVKPYWFVRLSKWWERSAPPWAKWTLLALEILGWISGATYPLWR